MQAYNIFFILIAMTSFIWKSIELIKAIKEKNKGKIKAELFFLLLTVLIVVVIAAEE
jgi:hypothetical protein